ncbi:hypothetical protein [Sphingomonas sp. Leaf4]|uniref:hypothetical protein n=1 Tax=Sphingomonas sp. Leaf4 TaxID=2876553 RepID=UPI001E5EA6AE|nr:hypothetical protein [Sphingomonas sp. Leaf4]
MVDLFDLLEFLGDLLPFDFGGSNKRQGDRPAKRRRIGQKTGSVKTKRHVRHTLLRRPKHGLNEND